jgi:hypothetical protein
MNPLEEALQAFLNEVERLERIYGPESVLEALELLLPGFDLETTRQGQPLFEGRKVKAATEVGKKVLGWAKEKIPGMATTATAYGVGTALGRAGTSGLDQDISIDDITTDKSLNVKSDNLEDLLTNTNKALAAMAQILDQTKQLFSSKLDNLDVSVDDLIATTTGETNVAARQQSGGRPPRRSEKEKAKK